MTTPGTRWRAEPGGGASPGAVALLIKLAVRALRVTADPAYAGHVMKRSAITIVLGIATMALSVTALAQSQATSMARHKSHATIAVPKASHIVIKVPKNTPAIRVQGISKKNRSTLPKSGR